MGFNKKYTNTNSEIFEGFSGHLGSKEEATETGIKFYSQRRL
jgi:hypothetical protein